MNRGRGLVVREHDGESGTICGSCLWSIVVSVHIDRAVQTYCASIGVRSRAITVIHAILVGAGAGDALAGELDSEVELRIGICRLVLEKSREADAHFANKGCPDIHWSSVAVISLAVAPGASALLFDTLVVDVVLGRGSHAVPFIVGTLVGIGELLGFTWVDGERKGFSLGPLFKSVGQLSRVRDTNLDNQYGRWRQASKACSGSEPSYGCCHDRTGFWRVSHRASRACCTSCGKGHQQTLS